MTGISRQILNHARRFPEGEILSTDSFLHLAKHATIEQELLNLVEQKKIFRIDSKMFVLSYEGQYVNYGPSTHRIIADIARMTGEKIAISGAAAANCLGLSKHVPMSDVFWTSGPDRIMELDGLKFELQHVPDWQLYAPNARTGDGIRAFVHLGELITDKVFHKFKSLLTEDERKELLDMRPNVPGWMADKFSTLATPAPTRRIMTEISQKILDHARRLPEGEILSTDIFLHLAKSETIKQELSHLVEQKKLFRIYNGMFVLSYEGQYVNYGPSTHRIIAGIARMTGEKIAISGAAAANCLGLSKHVPMSDVFWTSGPDRIMELDGLKFELQHVPDWQLYAPDTKTGDGIRAFAFLDELVTGKVFHKFESLLTEDERKELLDLRPNVPGWMADKFSTLAELTPTL